LANSYIEVLKNGLTAGKSFSALLSDLNFSDAVITQMSLAEIHGNTALSLQNIEDYLGKMAQVRKKLIEVATYPVILLL
ncbi:type II secretion system F family protein, partial [Streptococcus pyogenes]